MYEQYFRAAQAQPRGVVAQLGNIVAQIERACQKQGSYGNNRDGTNSWKEILTNAIDALTVILKDDGVVSAYELYSSGLVQALLNLLSISYWDQGKIKVYAWVIKISLNIYIFLICRQKTCSRKNLVFTKIKCRSWQFPWAFYKCLKSIQELFKNSGFSNAEAIENPSRY